MTARLRQVGHHHVGDEHRRQRVADRRRPAGGEVHERQDVVLELARVVGRVVLVVDLVAAGRDRGQGLVDRRPGQPVLLDVAGSRSGRLVVSQRWTMPPPSIGPGQLDDDRQDVQVREEVHRRGRVEPRAGREPAEAVTCGVSAAMMLGKSTCMPGQRRHPVGEDREEPVQVEEERVGPDAGEDLHPGGRRERRVDRADGRRRAGRRPRSCRSSTGFAGPETTTFWVGPVPTNRNWITRSST